MLNSKSISNIVIVLVILISLYFAADFLLASLEWSDIINLSAPSLILALVLTFIGYLLQTLTWWLSAKEAGASDYKITDALVDHGSTIFTKYIPGKVMATVSRAFLVSNKGHLTKQTAILTSLNNVVISILTGLALSSAILLIITDDFFAIFDKTSYRVIITAVLIALIVIVAIYAYRIFIHKQSVKLSLRFLSLIIIVFAVNWVLWSLGFSSLAHSLTNDFSFILGVYFVLSFCISIIAVIAPGGLGVREGLVVAFIYYLTGSMENAVLLSVLSRLLFLVGEALLFLMAMIVLQLRKD